MAFDRDQHREYQAKRRAKERDVLVPHVKNTERRLSCLADPFLFLPTYMPNLFFDGFSPERRHIVDEILRIAEYGGDKAIAAPRKCGKTSIAEGVTGVYCLMKGLLRFPLICAATGPHATRILGSVKSYYDDPCDAFREDFPEVVEPIVSLGGAANKCAGQTVNSERTRMHWSNDYIRFPRVRLLWCPECLYPETRERKGHRECPKCGETFEPWYSTASGRMMATAGLDGAVRGVKYGSDRPDYVLIDDPETRMSARSETECEKRELIIDNDIRGIGGGRRSVPRLMLTTLMYSVCLSAKYTDKKQMPSFDGERIPLVKRWPDAKEKWDTYIDMRREDQENGDQYARRAHQFYLDNQEEMDAGAVVTNADRYDNTILPDGTQAEVSTIQFVHNIAASSANGWDTVFTEYQNDPPDAATDDESKLTPFKVRGSHPDYVGRCNGMPRGLVPEDAIALTATIDVQKRTLYYQVVAWLPGQRRHIVDYGTFGDSTIADREGPAASVRANLRELWRHWRANPYCDSSEPVPFHCILVDSGYETDTVLECVRQFGDPWRASMGDSRYHHPKSRTKDKRPSRTGEPWYQSKQPGGWVINMDADHWKHKSHNSWSVPPQGDPAGSVTLFGNHPKEHTEFGNQVCAEEWVEEFKEGKGVRVGWQQMRRDNHYLDTDYMQMVAGSMCGVSGQQRPARQKQYGVISRGVKG